MQMKAQIGGFEECAKTSSFEYLDNTIESIKNEKSGTDGFPDLESRLMKTLEFQKILIIKAKESLNTFQSKSQKSKVFIKDLSRTMFSLFGKKKVDPTEAIMNILSMSL